MAEAGDGFTLVAPKRRRRRGRGGGSQKLAAKAAESRDVAACLTQAPLTSVAPYRAPARIARANKSSCGLFHQRGRPRLPRLGDTGVAAASRCSGVLLGAAVGHPPTRAARTGGGATALRCSRRREPQPEPVRCAAARSGCRRARPPPRRHSARGLRSLPLRGVLCPPFIPCTVGKRVITRRGRGRRIAASCESWAWSAAPQRAKGVTAGGIRPSTSSHTARAASTSGYCASAGGRASHVSCFSAIGARRASASRTPPANAALFAQSGGLRAADTGQRRLGGGRRVVRPRGRGAGPRARGAHIRLGAAR